GQEFLADRRQPVEGDQRVLLDVLLPVSVIVLRVAVGGQPELGDRQPLGTDDDLRVTRQAADEDDAVDHVVLPSKKCRMLVSGLLLSTTSSGFEKRERIDR